ncbi:choline transporter-like 2 isoform X4 [Manduca sexta]|uniref:choline transporter-like 2 isoform X4 n=1 Tax=Manduca sexta TaxID=7130 RepID=UPI0018906840|nr:choline transporter-like 2 isoform X4 [Manduca sexta]
MGCCGECCVPPKESREPIRYDPDFKGPVHNRSCTDIIWLILFILFLGVWGYVGYYSITRGNIENLLAPIDSKGRRCGLDSGLEDKKYLVFFDISKCLSPDSPIVGCSTPQVCVSKCPERFIRFGTELTPATMEQLRSSMVCTDDVNVRDMTYNQAMQYIKENKCAPYVLQSQPALYLCYKNYEYYRDNPVGLYQTTNLKGYAESIFSKKETWMALLVAGAILILILLLVVIFLRNRISIATALIREGSKAVTSIKSTIFFPIFPWVLQCVVMAYGVFIFMLILSIGENAFGVANIKNDTTCDCGGLYTEEGQSCDPAAFALQCRDTAGGACKMAICHFMGIKNPHSVVYLHLINLLGFFWTLFFISGVSDMILASTFSRWYWTFHKKDLPFFTLTSGIFQTLRYHLGTVAFGALIIAIVRVIRVILEYIDHKLKKFDNPLSRAIMCCCKCFFWCLESFLKFINKNAYIMCAVHGHSFCKSARDAFSLLMRNIVRVVVLDKVMDFIFFLSKLLISIGVGFAVYYLLQAQFVYDLTQGAQLHYNYIPAIILSIATYLICTIFFNVYAMAVDTLFLCFLEDCERNDGSAEKPYFMSKNLMKIVSKRNKQP